MTAIAPLSPPVLRRLAAILVPALILLAVAIGTLWLRERSSDRERARRSAFDAVRIQAHSTVRAIEMVSAILLYLSEDEELRRLAAGGGARERVEADFADFQRTAYMYEALRLLDAEGNRLAGPAGHGPVDRELVARVLDPDRGALAPGQVFVSRFSLPEGAGRSPVIHLATLVPRGDDASATEEAAVLVLDYRADSVLRLVQQTGLQLSGWTALVDADGHFLEAPGGLQDQSWTAQRGAPPAFARAHPGAFAVLRERRVGTHLDATGLYVFSGLPAPGRHVAPRSELALTAVCHVPSAQLYARSRRTLALALAAGAAAAGLIGAIGWRLALASAVRAEGERRLELSERGLRKLSARLVEAQEQERRRISRDLHDELGQQATAIAIGLKRAARTADPADRERMLALAIEATEELLGGIHRISTSLRTTMLDDLGLTATLEATCADLRERAGLAVVTELAFTDAEVPRELAQTVHRFVQEGLTNALKHARAEEVVVSVTARGDRLEAEVRDDGVGFDPRMAEDGERLGLLGMRERIELVRGEFRCDASPGSGTRLFASLPLTQDDVER